MQRFTLRKKTKTIELALTLSLAWGAAFAADEEGMFLDLQVNQQQRGEFAVYRSADGDFLVRLSDFDKLGLKRDISLPRVRVDGESGSYVSLRELGAIRLDLDLARLMLNVELPPEVFATTALNLSALQVGASLGSEQSSGFLNYRVADSSYAGVSAPRTLATELGLRYGSVLLLNQTVLRDNAHPARYLTQLVYDLPEVQQRYVLGDFVGGSGELGSALSMGGLNLSKVYSLAPDLVRQPLAGFAGVATSPSQVEVRVGGVPVSYSQVSAGPFELQNLRQYGGASDVQVLVRDALGREQVFDFPFYYSDQSLREGLHEYSYSLGKLRSSPGQPDEVYGATAFSAFHRYGYSDTLTLGARAESASELGNAGLGATWRSNQWGVLGVAASGSSYKGRSGDATLLSYSYQQPHYGLRSIARRYSTGYAPLESLLYDFKRSGEYGLSLSWYPLAGTSLAFNHTLTQAQNLPDSHSSSVNLYQHLSGASYLYATLQRNDGGSQAAPNNSLFISWQYRFGGKYSASASAIGDDSGHQTLATQVGQDVPYGPGFGYRVGWSGTQPEQSDRLSGYAQWNLPAASVTVDANTLSAQGARVDYRELALAGSVAFAGSGWGFSRQINDSFAIVQMGSELAGVRVLANSQEMGVSDSGGQVISPYLGSFYESRVSVDAQDVPLAYALGKDVFTVRPAYRSGVSVNFGLRRVHGLDGVVRVRTPDGSATADDLLVTLTRNGQLEQEFQLGKGGYFYLENIAAGSYRGEISRATGLCSFVLEVPETQEVVFSVPGDLLCE